VADAPVGTDWRVVAFVKVTDGDTLRLVRERTIDFADDYVTVIRDRDEVKGVPIRLVTLDTPERGQPGWGDAKADLTDWVFQHAHELMVTTYGETGGFDRYLGDLWVAGDRGNTASQHMLRDKGWPPYVRGQ
jgi:endonuclease YncB( thermonuclease family)